MKSSGRTPLLRAKKIESMFGLGEVYLKLEGANPHGHKFDRIGETIVRDALAGGFSSIIADGPRRYLHCLKQFADEREIGLLVPLFPNQAWKRQDFAENELIDLKRTGSEDRVGAIERICTERNCYNGATGYHNSHLSILALEEIGEELVERLDDITTVFAQLSYGYTVSSLYNSFFRGWTRGELDRYPKIYSCTIPKGNRIYEDYKKQNGIDGIDDYEIKLNKYTKELYIENTQLLEDSLGAIRDTNGQIVSIDEKTLKEASNDLRKSEMLSVSAEECYGFAGFYKLAKEGRLEKGRHVVILNDGRADIDIQRIEDFSEHSSEELLAFVDTFLQQYGDPEHEMRDAIAHAVSRGAIFLAKMNGEIQGITVVVHTGFEEFLPKYHLAYIGTKPGRKGRGIASSLIEQVIAFTEGNVSLHVDLDNSRARKLYEKFGFKTKYFRMMYAGG